MYFYLFEFLVFAILFSVIYYLIFFLDGKYIRTWPNCGKTFTKQFNLSRHISSRTSEKEYSCHLCKRIFSHHDNVHRHLKLYHEQKA